MSPRAIRLSAALLPSSLLLHECAYALTGGADRSSHSYLEIAIPLLAAAAACLAVAIVLAPRLGAGGAGGIGSLAPFVLAGCLVAIFGVQELTEALLLGGGPAALAGAAAAAWLLPPLALVLALLATGLIEWLERAGRLLVAIHADPSAPARAGRPPVVPSPVGISLPSPRPLAFGLARRPPPHPA